VRIKYEIHVPFVERVERQNIETGEWERLVTGSIGDPQNVDCYGNRTKAEELRSGMIVYMENYRNVGVDHVRDSAGNAIAWNDERVVIEKWIERFGGEMDGVFLAVLG
jgi:hypothetical protein